MGKDDFRSDGIPDEAKPLAGNLSVAPFPPGYKNKCPECNQYMAGTEKSATGVWNNTCYSGCGYNERVTPDHVPRLFTEAEVRELVSTDPVIQGVIDTKVREAVTEAMANLNLPRELGGLQKMG